MDKNLQRRVRRLRAVNSSQVVEVGAKDEARLGLEPITRRVWWLKGCRTRFGGQTRSKWLSVYGFARPATRETVPLIRPRVNVERMEEALAGFAAHADPEGNNVLVLVVHNAGWHTAKRFAVPPNIRLHFLPPCTPHCSRLGYFGHWSWREVANDTFDRRADLRLVVRRRGRRLAADHATVQGAIGFRWATNL